ncbi:Excinuclease ABC subunit A [Cytobacillus oceanisediminis]|uniref:UvrABC system protein A n=1 Tax=Cytobacillus oceanisediminis TaxID=665099 RepID=A0A562JS28_9BACI|nr:hypothetical protein IQ19_02907 [Cytobacillus oceanisediminis]
MSDNGHLLEIMNRLVGAGNTVIVIEHNLDVISQVDWIIDMGPDGWTGGVRGHAFADHPWEQSITGRYLA